MTDGKHKASVTIDAKVDAADRDIKKLTRRINQMQKGLDRSDKAARRNSEALKTIGRVGAVAATAAAGAAVGLFKLAEASAETANKTAKASKALGIASDGLQKLEFAASRATTATSEQLHKGIAALTVGLEDAAVKGTGPVAEGLDAIGLSAADLLDKDIETQFGVLADAMAKIPNQADRSAASMKLFGRRAGLELKPLLDEGSRGLKAYGAEAQRLGLVLDRKALAASEDFVDSLSDTKQTLAAVVRDIGIAAVPAFKDASDGIREWTVENRELIDQDLPEVLASVASGIGAIVSVTAEAVRMFVELKQGAVALAESLAVFEESEQLRVARDPRTGKRLSAETIAASQSVTGVRGVGGIAGAQGEAGRARHATRVREERASTLALAISAGRAVHARFVSDEVQAALEGTGKVPPRKPPQRRGSRGEQQDLMTQMLEADQARMSSFTEDVGDLSFLDSGTVDPFSIENRQIHLDELARMAEEERQIENVRREGLLQDKMLDIEMQRELGVDPIVLLEREQQARLEHNDFLMQQADGEAAVLAVKNDRRKIYHDAEMKRLQLERQAQEKQMQVYQQVGDTIGQVYQATAAAAIASAVSQGNSVREAVRSSAKAEAVRSGITALSSFVQAAFWSAVPGGQAAAAHFTAAGIKASAAAVSLGALAGSLGAGSGGGGGRRTGAPQLGVGAAGATRPQSALPSSSSLPGSTSTVPGSPLPAGRPGGETPSPQRRPEDQGGVNLSGATVHLYGVPEGDFLDSVDRGLRRRSLQKRT